MQDCLIYLTSLVLYNQNVSINGSHQSCKKNRLNTINGPATLKESKQRNPSVFSVNSNTQPIILKYLTYKTLCSQRFKVIYLSTILCSDVYICKLDIVPCTSLYNVLFQLYHCTVSALHLQYLNERTTVEIR
jgi:hypothetical protein